jgi:hypothetical protein
VAAPWKKHIDASRFDPGSVGSNPSPEIPGDGEALLDGLTEFQAPCPVIVCHADAPETKAKLNTMNAIMEIMVAVTRRPGSLASSAERDAAVTDLLRMIRTTAESFAPVISTQSSKQPWVTGQATRFMAHLVAQQWLHQGNHDVSQAVGMLHSAFESPEFNAFANAVGSVDYKVTEGKDDAIARINLSLSKVTSSIYYEVRRFSFYRDPPEIALHLLKRLVDVIQGEKAYLDVAADLQISRTQSRIGRLGDLVAAEYAETIDKAMEALIDVANKNPTEFAPSKARLAGEWQHHADLAFERALKGYQNADALTEQVLARFQSEPRASSTLAPQGAP